MPSREPLPIADRGLAVKFGTIGAWSIAFSVFLPDAYAGVLGELLSVLLTAATVGGAMLAIAGLIRRDNLVIEVAGLIAMLAGPIVYLIVVLIVGVIGVLSGNTDRVALVFLALLQVEVVGVRLAFLIHRRRAVTAEAGKR